VCGIAGLLAPAGGAPPEPALVDAMLDALRHRGPDEAGTIALGRCVLGARRLRVVDLAPTGRQPATNEAGDVAAVHNGEVYGFPALRDELVARGHDVPGSGDTAVLPHLYEEHGAGMAARLDGMFATAVWDASAERLVLLRDRLGKKPLAWTRLADGTFAFASEVKALAALSNFDRTPDLRSLDAYLALGYVPPGGSAFAGVRRLPPGHVLVVDDAGERVERYWSPAAASLGPRPEAEWLELVRAEVGAAVRRRLISDVPLGALLSGGIDSSVVVALMAQAASGRVRTFTIGFGDERYDERHYARAVAERWGTEHEELVVEPDAAAVLPRLAEAFDEPFADSSALPTMLVSELARRHITVALGGDGGDEAFGGYERYLAHSLAARVPGAPARAAARLLRTVPAARREPRSPLFRAARFLSLAGLGPAERYGQLMELFPGEMRRSLWSDDALAELGPPAPTAALLGAPRRPGVRGLQLADLETYLPGDLLVKADLASMACSLEVRSPLLDHRVVELGLALPDELKLRGRHGKVAVRRAFAADLPQDVRARGKRGFGVPVSRWFRDELRDLAGDVLLDATARARGLLRTAAVERLVGDHVAGRADHGARLWALVMLELWYRRYVDMPAAARAAVALPPP
jgi:asparagine synthase (glutamine-hydrolysing)